MRSVEATERGVILDFLERIDRRLRLDDVLRSLSQALWALPGFLIAAKLWGPIFLAIYGAVLLGYLLWVYRRTSRQKGLERSAVVADSRADLKDALKSSLAFLGLPERSEWMIYQIGRTAAVAEGLDGPEIAPHSLPRAFYHASGLAAIVAAVITLGPLWFPSGAGVGFWPFGQRGEPETMAELLDEPAEDLVVPEIPPNEEAASQLRERNLDLAESLRKLEETQEALAASRVDMEKLHGDFERLAEELGSSATLSELAEALGAQNAEQAAELLRQLAERLAESGSPEELQALLEALENASVQQADLAQLLEQLANASANTDPQSLAEMMEALRQTADQLESMGQQMGQQPLDEMSGEAMQSLQASLGQQQQAPGQQSTGQQQQQAGGQAMASASGMMTQLQMAQMQGDPSNAVPMDAGPAGDATGPGGAGEEQVMGEATTLDVQLEMEILKAEERDQPVPEEIFERLSREEKSTLNYEAVSPRGSYADEKALSHEAVPWPYRALVKRYFLSLVAISEAKAESSNQK
ncbi:MAG TPA: hypothetical protein VLK65_25820 [Vicinamibacteria bacterium]|nr:hypothetical protein [Vicinamibacteria bacterium]